MKIMAKKVLILSSSPRRGGNSDRLCDRFMAGAQQAGHEVEKIFLKDRRIGYCTGCGACYGGAGPCPQKDDAAGVIGKMVEADVIVMATPVYFYTLSAQMKTLIDRCCARYLEMTRGLEELLKTELENLGAVECQVVQGGVHFKDRKSVV